MIEFAGPYSAQQGAIHHAQMGGFVFTVVPAGFAPDVADALNGVSAAARLMRVLTAIVDTHYDEDGIIDPATANAIVGQDQTGRLQLKGSFIAQLESARREILALRREA